MSKLREGLKYIPKNHLSKPDYVEHKKQLWWGSSERRNYLRSYISYAADKAALNFVYAMAATIVVMYAQPHPQIEIRLLSPDITTNQSETTRPSSSTIREPSPAAKPSTIYEHSKTQSITVWANGPSKTTSSRPR